MALAYGAADDNDDGDDDTSA
eukprot:COSAG05_NODE_12212_length_477_cov_1.378307_1_plen_20_part_10